MGHKIIRFNVLAIKSKIRIDQIRNVYQEFIFCIFYSMENHHLYFRKKLRLGTCMPAFPTFAIYKIKYFCIYF